MSQPFADAWGAATPVDDWSMPLNDLPDPRVLVCCKGCPGASHLNCCQADASRVRARREREFSNQPEANGARGRRFSEFLNFFLRRSEQEMA